MLLLRMTWMLVLERASSLALKTFRELVFRSLKISLQNDGSVNVLGLHTHLEDQSSRLVFKTAMKTCCKQYLTVLKRASSLGLKTSEKLVLRALKIRLQNDGSVNVLRSSYTSSRLVSKMFLSDICEDVLQTIFNQRFEDPTVEVLKTTWILVLKRVFNLGCKTSRILVSRNLKIRLQNDGSVNFFKSSYTSWRLVLKTGLQNTFLPAGLVAKKKCAWNKPKLVSCGYD